MKAPSEETTGVFENHLLRSWTWKSTDRCKLEWWSWKVFVVIVSQNVCKCRTSSLNKCLHLQTSAISCFSSGKGERYITFPSLYSVSEACKILFIRAFFRMMLHSSVKCYSCQTFFLETRALYLFHNPRFMLHCVFLSLCVQVLYINYFTFYFWSLSRFLPGNYYFDSLVCLQKLQKTSNEYNPFHIILSTLSVTVVYKTLITGGKNIIFLSYIL